MPLRDDVRRPARIGFVLALLVSSVLHAAVLIGSGFVPYAEARRAGEGTHGSEFVMELRLRPAPEATNDAIELGVPEVVCERAAEAEELALDASTVVDPSPSNASLPEQDPMEAPRETQAVASLVMASESEPLTTSEAVTSSPLAASGSRAIDATELETPRDASGESVVASTGTVPPTKSVRASEATSATRADDPVEQPPPLSPASTTAKPSSVTSKGTGSRAASLLENPRPAYPSASRRLGEQGCVTCLLHVRADGTVERVEVLHSSGFSRLDRAATDGLRRWRFAPALENGAAVATTVRHKVTFVVE